jgi:type I restriction enzyme, S subunit
VTSFVPLKRRANVRYGLGQPPPLSDTGVAIIRATNIFRGRVDGSDLIRSRIEDLPLDRAPLLTAGEVLVVRSGAYTGDSALITPDWAGAAPGYDLRVTPGPKLEPRFAAYSLLGRRALDQIDLAKSRAAQPHLNAEDLREVGIFDTPVSTQSAIADYLDRESARIDTLIAAKRRMRRILDQRWQVVMHAAVAGRLPRSTGSRRQTSVPWLTDTPSHWREGLLKLVAKLGSGHTPSRSHSDWWVDPQIPWITTGEVAQMRSDRIEYITETRERISELGMANSAATLHPAGTVVLCRTASAGYSAIMGRDMATSQDFAVWTCGPLLRPRFLLLCLRAMRRDLLQRLAMGSTHKTIYMPDIESIKIPVPPVEEQDRLVFAAYAEHRPLDQSAKRIEEQISLLHERRQALITAAVTGQLPIASAA